ncbi:Growth arrest-specific protein 7 [Sciurus carolinensis]|uniref:Growth arrest-specific protein 7 n=1 Tax=Sciurus carolinensis TaxID=30640 RepID=A0AA41N6U6_SCICA|nr:Growth arrest-specific protein 7 [Sciurus carolinensis]
MKKCDHHKADLRKYITSCIAFVEKAQKALTEWQRDLEIKIQQLEIKLSNKKEDMHGGSPPNGDDLMLCVDLYNKDQFKWFEEIVTITWRGSSWKWRG